VNAVQAQKPIRVPPLIAGLVSVIIPGLGHALVGRVRQGLLLLASLVSVIGLLAWRISIAGRRIDNWPGKIQRSFELHPILLVLSIGTVLLYLWIIVDAYLSAKPDRRSTTVWLFALVTLLFFGLGWQIGEIQPVKLVTQAGDGLPFMQRIIWPWDAAIVREEELQIARAVVQIPCYDEPVPTVEPDGPALSTSPQCGNLSQPAGEPGTTLHITGTGFEPGSEVAIWWKDEQGNEFRQRQGGEYLVVMPDEQGNIAVDVVMPYRLMPTEKEVSYWEVQGRQLAGVGPAHASPELLLAIEKMIETIFLGMMATFFGIIFSVPFSFLAARNLMSGSWVTLAIYYLVRTVMNIVRSIESLIWAVIAIVVVGLGPFAGIVALTVHTIAALGKLYSEAIESIDPGPIEAIQATGANWLQTVVYGVIPQIIPPFVSFTIYRWDINVRMSTVIGLVGGGGIGFILIQWIRLLDYRSAGIAVWFISITVAILDYVSAEIRERFV